MSYRKTIALCSEIRRNCINTLCEQNVESLNVAPRGRYSYHWPLFCFCELSQTGFIFFECLISVNVPTLRLSAHSTNKVHHRVSPCNDDDDDDDDDNNNNILFTHQQMHFLLNLEKFKFT